jgi:ABC-type polysaccharide/polyol phosphate export permease
MYHLVKLFRTPVYAGVVPELSQILIAAIISLTVLIAGWLVFTKKADEFAYRV